jgi:hypothetical protein
MTGRRARRLLQEDMAARFHRLGQFFGCYLHEDRGIFHGSPEQALDAAIADHPVAMRQEVRRQLAAVMAEYPDNADLGRVLNDGLGVNLYFKQPADARTFAEMVDRRLLESIEAHFDRSPSSEQPAT